MPALRAQLSVKLDASSLVQTFLTNMGASTGTLQGIADPTPLGQIAAVNADLGKIDLSSLEGSVSVLAQGALSITGSLPIAADVVKPVTDAIALLEALLANPELGDFEARLKALTGELSGILEGPRANGFLGALHAVALALGDAPAAKLIKELILRLTAAGGVTIPSVPITDAILALDGTVRVVGGLMVLDSVTADIARLTRLMSARLNPQLLDMELASLEAALSFEGGQLSAAMAAVDIGNLPRLQRITLSVTACAAALDRIRDEYAAAMGFGEATLVYLDVESLTKELDTGRTLIRTGDLAALNRLCTQLAGGLQPFLKQDLLTGPVQDLDALFASVEGKLTGIAGQIEGLDVAALVQPLADGMSLLTAPLDRLTALLDQVRVTYQGALGSVRDAVAALPVKSIADAIRALLEPIANVVATLRKLVTDVLGALQAAATAVTTALGTVEGHVDKLKADVDALFGEVKKFVDSLNLDQALGAVEENIRKLATALEKARIEPYCRTAGEAISTAADVIGAIPFDMLPESMKADVDAAVAPIKEADATVVSTEVKAVLQITPEGHFAILNDVDAAVATLQQSYDALLAEVKKYEPREALKSVDAKLKELAAEIQKLSPAVTLQPVRDAIDRVKETIASLDVDKPLKPVRDAFASITSAVNGFKPSTLIGGVEDRIVALRQQVSTLLRLPQIEQTLDDTRARAVDLLDRYDADLVQRRLELAMQEFITLADSTPRLDMMSGLGAIVAGLLSGMGLRVYPASFETVLRWLGGASASAELNARVAGAGASVAAMRETVGSLDFQARVASLVGRVANVRAEIGPLQAKLGNDSSFSVSLSASAPRLDAEAVFGFLDANRARFAVSLADATQRLQVIAQAGFSDADVRVTNLKAAIAPLDPGRSYMRRLLERVGFTGFALGLAGVLRALFRIVTPARLVGLVRPILDALKGRIVALIDAILNPLKAGVAKLRAALEAIDLGPLIQSLDALHAEVLAQIQALSPDALLGPALAEVTALQQTLVSADPLAPVIAILNGVRDTVARVLAKLSLEKLLEIPLGIYDDLLKELSRLDIAKLSAPLRAQLDDIALQVSACLDETVVSFQRLQAALPSGGGGATVEVGVSVSVG